MFCYSEWTKLLRDREKGVTVRSRGHFRLPECETLPRMAASTANNTCTKSGITDMRYDLATSKTELAILLTLITFSYDFPSLKESTVATFSH